MKSAPDKSHAGADWAYDAVSGKRKWRRDATAVVDRLIAALEPEDTVLGGGNVHKLKTLPPHTRAGDNDNVFRGGFRLWEKTKISGTEKVVPKGGPE
jgi:hypothetical protein